MGTILSEKCLIYGILILVGIGGAVGDTLVNIWARSHRWEWWIASCIMWIAVATLFGMILRRQYFTFGVAVVLALLIHTVIVLLIDRFWYGTYLNMYHWIGIVFAALAFCLIEMGRSAEDVRNKPTAPIVPIMRSD